MAIYHFSVKAVSRSAGRSATAAAAYRAGCEIADKRTGEIHDYTRKGGIASADIVLPDGAPEWATDRSALWNAAESAERRKDACVAREYEVALPDELSPDERRRLALDFAKEIANAEGCAVDVSIHAPGKEGDSRNHHAHILRTTRKVGPDGLTDKLDTEKAGRKRSDDLAAVRTRWADLTNERLHENGIEARVDHRSLADQGIEREPTKHLGPFVTDMERRGVKTEVCQRIADEVADRLTRAAAAGLQERELAQVEKSIFDLSGDLAAAKRDLAIAEQARSQLVSGAADFRNRLMAERSAPSQPDIAKVAIERYKTSRSQKPVEIDRAVRRSYVGPIVDIKGDDAYQDIGDGKIVVHNFAYLRPVSGPDMDVGHVADIKYHNNTGHITVQDDKAPAKSTPAASAPALIKPDKSRSEPER